MATDETRIIPQLRNYMGDVVTAPFHDADWFRVEFEGKWIGDYRSIQEANAALASACFARDDAALSATP